MRHALIALAAAAQVAALAAPAAAQTYGAGRYSASALSDREATLRHRVNANLEDGYLTSAQAADLSDRLDRIADLDANYRDDGFSPAQREDIAARLDRIESSLRYDVAMNTDNTYKY